MLCSNCKKEIVITEREMEVCLLAAAGMTNVKIGKELFISEKTVKNHLGNAYFKLGLHDKLDLTKYFLQKGDMTIEDIRKDGAV